MDCDAAVTIRSGVVVRGYHPCKAKAQYYNTVVLYIVINKGQLCMCEKIVCVGDVFKMKHWTIPLIAHHCLIQRPV